MSYKWEILLLAYPYFYYRGIVVTNAVVNRSCPVIGMDMFCLCTTTTDGRRHKHVVQLLTVIVKYVCVPLHRGNTRHLVNIGEQRGQGCKNCSRLEVFVAITGDNDICVRVLL